MEKKILGTIAVIAILAVALAAGYVFVSMENGGESITVLAAGSLAVPFSKIAQVYEKEYGIKVNIETAGSIQTVKKVSELHRKADIVAVADYNAIQSYLVPNYTSWYIKFAKNALVVVYTPHSKYASEINGTNWMSILSRKDVRIGFSSPNDDPCGYRSVMMFYLASKLYNSTIFRDVVENNTGIRVNNGIITVPDDSQLLNLTGKVFIKQKSVALLGDLESGDIDYAIEYMSVAKQHGLKYITLPDDINLSNSSKSNIYKEAVVQLADGKKIQGGPINYGITVPNNAPHRDAAYKFVNLLIGKKGREIMDECGQPPMYEPVGKVPEEIKP
ncbi:MAG: tungstate ABC transporter substrate-binding protein WtpA [Euryarchaeota archaeon]|nr:tungstate ABC transporter substrate-binding protein WtpA [Euryarchaeota archaeon]